MLRAKIKARQTKIVGIGTAYNVHYRDPQMHKPNNKSPQ